MTRHTLGQSLVSPKWRTTNMSQWLFRNVVAIGRWGTRASGTLLLWGWVGFGAACSSDEKPPADPAPLPLPTGEVNVEVSYPNAVAESVTAVLHAWVLAEREGARVSEDRANFNCASLIGGSLDPYDLTLVRRADVASTEDVRRITAQHVAPGDGLVYVEAGSFNGEAEFAGCSPTTVTTVAVGATVELAQAKVFDCANPDTEDGSPCDDGRLCTVGETCDNGTCGDGAARDCDFGADSCHAGQCNETEGCVVQPLPNGTSCDDEAFCTEGDACSDGECVGTARDCAEDAATCQIAVGCDETNDRCVTTPASFGTTCDDGLFCTEFDTCNGVGSCTGTTRNCAIGVPQCQVNAGCDDVNDTCITSNSLAGSFCSDGLFCTDDACNGSGACVGTAIDCSAFGDDICSVGTCDELAGGFCEATPFAPGTDCGSALSCTADICDGAGTCDTGTDLPDTTPCDDGDDLTSPDACSGGLCVGTPPP